MSQESFRIMMLSSGEQCQAFAIGRNSSQYRLIFHLSLHIALEANHAYPIPDDLPIVFMFDSDVNTKDFCWGASILAIAR